MAITWTEVGYVAPELATFAVARQNFILTFVLATLNSSVWGDKYDMACALYAAHLGTVMDNGGHGPGGPITSETIGPASKSYAAPAAPTDASQFSMTSYGRQYLELVKQLPERWGVL